MNRVIAGEPVTDSELDGNDIRQGIVGLFQTLIYIAGTVVFIIGSTGPTRTSTRSRRRSGGTAPARRSAAGYVPIMNLFRPKQVVNDVWRAGRPYSDTEGREPGWLLLSWWLL